MSKVDITCRVITSPRLYFFGKTPQVFICKFLITNDMNNGDSDRNMFPIICFNRKAKEVADKIKMNDIVRIRGTFRDFSYNDCNLAKHKVKILLASDVKHDIGKEPDKDMEPDEDEENSKFYDLMLSNGYEILNFSEKQRLIS